MSARPKRSEQAVDVALAVTFLVAAAGAAIVVVSLVFDTRETLPALGAILLIVGAALGSQFGLRPALRQNRSAMRGTINGLRMLWNWSRRMVGTGGSKS